MLPIASHIQTRLYAAQAARKVEVTGAAERIKFQPQDVQVSSCSLLILLYRDDSMRQPERANPFLSLCPASSAPLGLHTPSRMYKYVGEW